MKRGLPTHAWMCPMNWSKGIRSSHLSQNSFPLSMMSRALFAAAFAPLVPPSTSCLALSSSRSFFTGKAFFFAA